jgi:hypothetical protein
MKRWIWLSAFLAGAIGCGDDTQATGDAIPPDAPIDARAADGPSADAAICNALELPDGSVMQMAVAAQPPTPMGGAATPGLYVLTSDIIYTGSDGGAGLTGNTTRAVILSTPSTYDYLGEFVGPSGTVVTSTSGTYSESGTDNFVHQICPTDTSFTFQYTNTATTYSQFGLAANIYPEVLTYTKQ